MDMASLARRPPGAAGAFGVRPGDRPGGGIAKGHEHSFGPVALAAAEFGHGLPEAVEPKIAGALGPVNPVQEVRRKCD